MMGFLISLGEITDLFLKTCWYIFKRAYHGKNVIYQMMRVGVESIPASVLTALSVGMVFAVHVSVEFSRYGAGKVVGGIVGVAVWRELAPLLTGVVVAGRVGAAIAAEIGTMKVTEQIEALETMAVSPISYLVVPRFIALTIMMPILVVFCDIVGLFGGFLISVFYANVNPVAFISAAYNILDARDLWGGLLKALFFGMVISLVACYQGLTTTKGAKGVGNSTTNSVVISLMTIFIINYFLSLIIFGK
ncbi:MAG: ABC transporter permease [Candidatus Margulisiibacteriota bacterium]|jgi:phospholipid/cholesterol/gamma-HCH transport system permease protein